MKPFSERNPIVIALIGSAITLGVVLLAMNYDRLPFVSTGKAYSAYFADAGALRSGADVEVSGYKAGRVEDVRLDG